MGWWDEGIMGGDTPLDFKGNFEDKFGSTDPEFNEWREEDGKPTIPFVKPDPQEVLTFINDFDWRWGRDDEPILKQVTGFLLMERGAPMNDELRALIIQGIDEEISEGAPTWNSPETRIARLQEFRKAVESYPAAGANVEMPESPGLLSKLAEHLSR